MKRHLLTIVSVAALVLAAWLWGLMPAQAGNVQPGGNGGSAGGGGAAGASQWAPNVNLTGTDSQALGTQNVKYTLTANETLTLTTGITASATSLVTWNMEICQNATGNFTLAFTAGTGISAICFSGDGGTCTPPTGQPGYTLTASNGDYYTMTFNGTDLVMREIVSNVACQ